MTKRPIPSDVRKVCYERDNETCQWDGCELSRHNGDRINLHHVLPEQFGGKEVPDNLITLCDIHHKNMHIEFHAFYPDSHGILLKMNRLTKGALSRIRRLLGVDDGFDLTPYLYFLTKQKTFRPGQLKTIRAALAGESVLFVTPTGSGKSVCYQLPGLLADQSTLVVSPLKALMKDQVESIWSKKIPTTYINSDLATEEKKKRYGFIREKLYKFIFVAPERFGSKDPQTAYLYNDYAHLVVDEAHSIEMWGMAFRPSYRKLGQLRERLGNPPVIALTATASKESQAHILESLNISEARVIVTGFERKNIEILVHKVGELDENGYPKVGKHEYVKRVLAANPDQKILIFTPTIKAGEDLLEDLRKNNLEVELYHSKLESKQKMQIQNRFTGTEKPENNILISTSAFGMGIDIPNIRHVIHLSPSLSVTDYTQQIGRAGRDGFQSYAHLLYSPMDDGLLEFMAQLPMRTKNFKELHGYQDEDLVRVKAKLNQQVIEMLELIDQPRGTEWSYILDYFGEVPPSFWERNGKNITNVLLIGILVLLMIYLVNIFV
ncbi:RecQ family ATP-dependent DNA helicase [Candidatus Saccharibacteria bacterium]|nr:RecQ family ATP-dependent DNA helicase [Candidatus Saccharibacteria bacterium]